MNTHTLHATPPNLHARFSAHAAPALAIDPGDTVIVRDIPDVSWGLEPPTSTTAPRRKVEPRPAHSGPCLAGPIAVRSARPGDVLEIAIEHIRPGPWGWTYAGKGLSTPALNSALGLPPDTPLVLLRWTIDREAGIATNHLGHTLPIRPFLGTLGLSPAEPDADAWTPRPCGGNMDCRELVAGSTLFLPVMTEGALLSLGDGHAAQADGELSGTAIECPIEEARLRISLRTDLRIATPRAVTPAGVVTMGFAETLDRAAEIAASAMLDYLCETHGLPRPEALALASWRVSLRITQMVNPLRGVHALLAPADF